MNMDEPQLHGSLLFHSHFHLVSSFVFGWLTHTIDEAFQTEAHATSDVKKQLTNLYIFFHEAERLSSLLNSQASVNSAFHSHLFFRRHCHLSHRHLKHRHTRTAKIIKHQKKACLIDRPAD